MRFHIAEDGTIPCTNCGKNVKIDEGDDWWTFVHEDDTITCDVTPYEGQQACPEAPNDDPAEWTTPMRERWPSS